MKEKSFAPYCKYGCKFVARPLDILYCFSTHSVACYIYWVVHSEREPCWGKECSQDRFYVLLYTVRSPTTIWQMQFIILHTLKKPWSASGNHTFDTLKTDLIV